MPGDGANSEMATPQAPALCARDIEGPVMRRRDRKIGRYSDVATYRSKPKSSRKTPGITPPVTRAPIISLLQSSYLPYR